MTTYLALFRGINVGGHNMLAMKDLVRLIEQNGCDGVRTYIQSGNAIFRSSTTGAERVAKLLAAAVSASHGFEPHVLVLTREELAKAAAANPYPDAVADPKSLHLFFLAQRPPRPDLESMEAIRAKTERFALKGRTFYLHTPKGFGTSKLAARAERPRRQATAQLAHGHDAARMVVAPR
jgi:uncharacterized protein (DUF1697 family)